MRGPTEDNIFGGKTSEDREAPTLAGAGPRVLRVPLTYTGAWELLRQQPGEEEAPASVISLKSTCPDKVRD